ncbi:glycosyl hydrolase [Acrocarpospora pleiomorpha]|uniref:Glycosyl hydrolase n=1 Tax=Acrocarpospora pleiomorpha TaxID=90975 RepID=A0A5M3XLR1_9ACTN|nr:family 10 glycosylhydrolase [Acrocarpospora pleiomorpha]GES21676.1 glycosyl hydrolase [Acrocarpospora pleiomorpha]
MKRQVGQVLAVATVAVSAASVAAYALTPGTATGGNVPPATCAPGSDKRQLRGMWITTVHNLDWPSKTGLSPDRQRSEYVKLLDTAVKRKFNAVFLQVRPASDAVYRSSLEPWSKFLTGTAGKDPGWDPLPFLVDEAHKRGLEFHAWFNPYRAAYDDKTAKLPAGHPARVHPEWTVKHEGRLYYNPGLPQVRDHVTRVIKDVVRRYDVDGVHFDDYFYPYPGSGAKFADSAAFRKYGDGKTLANWRRSNVNKLVAQVSKAVRETKPYVKFGISPFGIWRNKSDDPNGSNTRGMSAYDQIYADPKAWIKAGSVDYLTPQLYWPRGLAIADYKVLVPWWAKAVRGTGVDLYIGQALYQVGTEGAWSKAGEMPAHLALNQKFPEVKGDVYFSASQVRGNPLKVMDRLEEDHYARPALLPLIQGLPKSTPAAPAQVRAVGGALVWQAQPGARAYAVYRTSQQNSCATADGRNLVAVIPASASPAYQLKAGGFFHVTALDRLHNESAPTTVKITLP